MAKKKLKAEEEIKEEVKTDLEDTDKDLDIKDQTDEVADEASEQVDEEVTDETSEESESESEDVLVLDSGATVDENTGLSEEEAEDLVKITKPDGTELFVEEVEGDDEEKKEIYEAIVSADSPADEVSEELESEVNDELANDEIEEVAYVPAACNTAHASLNNSFYVLKLKSGKIKALKAGKIFTKSLKAAILDALDKKQELPDETTLFNKIAHKIGYTFGAFNKLAKKLTASKKSVKSAELPDTVPGVENDQSKELENFSLDTKDIQKSKLKSQVALKDVKMETGVKSAPSKVKNYFNRLPAKSEVGDEVEWSLKDFNKENNKAEKTMASQIKSLRDATKELRAQKEVIAAKEQEIKTLQEKLASIQNKEDAMLKSAKINKIMASMNITDEEEKYAMTEKFAKYSKEQLNAIYETLTACPSEEATVMHERMINEQMKKEASELEGFVPSVKLEEDVKTDDYLDKLVLERELQFQEENYKG